MSVAITKAVYNWNFLGRLYNEEENLRSSSDSHNTQASGNLQETWGVSKISCECINSH